MTIEHTPNEEGIVRIIKGQLVNKCTKISSGYALNSLVSGGLRFIGI